MYRSVVHNTVSLLHDKKRKRKDLDPSEDEFGLNERKPEVSPVASISSVASVSVSTEKSERDIRDTTHNLQVQSLLRPMPTSIKRLLVGIFVVLAGIIVLISNRGDLIQRRH